MPLLYTVIIKDKTILCDHANCQGNFSEITKQILNKIQLNQQELSYKHERFMFHYTCADNIIYMCMTDDDFDRKKAFMHLAGVKKNFLAHYGKTSASELPNVVKIGFSNEIAKHMKQNNRSSTDVRDERIKVVRGQIDEVKGLLREDIEKLVVRGERLERLVVQSEELSNNTHSFLQSSRSLARKARWRNIRTNVMIGLICLVVVYIVLSMFCGGLTWSKCL